MRECLVCKTQIPELEEDYIGLPQPMPIYNECCSKECARTFYLGAVLERLIDESPRNT